ncbi:MAG: hypothetical protein IGQ45_13510 [Cyanobacterium sp. T60_A2020_053]|nr:hypothetical protein [Cyanobacterium sp. T60_A2020_053]
MVEGADDHCCEYMTGGLGYLLGEDNTFEAKVNPEIIKIQRNCSPEGEA